MDTTETARPAHQNGGGPRESEQLGGQLGSTNSPNTSTAQVPNARTRTGVCRECGAVFRVKRETREFCRTACRQAFNNRKATNGGSIYDLAMAWRFDRANFRASGGFTLLSRMLANFHADDKQARGGRRSWDSAARVKHRNPHLAATVIGVKSAGTRAQTQFTNRGARP
jgi:hypothetical protein